MRTADIERAVEWALVELAAEGGVSVGFALSAGGSNALRIANYMALGTVIDTGGGAWGGGGAVADPDAVTIRSAIDCLDDEARGLVLAYGRRGRRPDVMADACPRLGPVLDDDDVPKVSRKWGPTRREIPQYCPLAWEVSPAEIRAHRSRYSAWRSGLCALVEILSARPLLGLTITGPAARAEPVCPWAVDAPVLHVIPPEAYPDHGANTGQVHRSNRDPRQGRRPARYKV